MLALFVSCPAVGNCHHVQNNTGVVTRRRVSYSETSPLISDPFHASEGLAFTAASIALLRSTAALTRAIARGVGFNNKLSLR